MAWMYFGGLLLGLLTRGRQLLVIPYGLGFVAVLVPVLLGSYYMRASIKLKKSASGSETGDPA